MADQPVVIIGGQPPAPQPSPGGGGPDILTILALGSVGVGAAWWLYSQRKPAPTTHQFKDLQLVLSPTRVAQDGELGATLSLDYAGPGGTLTWGFGMAQSSWLPPTQPQFWLETQYKFPKTGGQRLQLSGRWNVAHLPLGTYWVQAYARTGSPTAPLEGIVAVSQMYASALEVVSEIAPGQKFTSQSYRFGPTTLAAGDTLSIIIDFDHTGAAADLVVGVGIATASVIPFVHNPIQAFITCPISVNNDSVPRHYQITCEGTWPMTPGLYDAFKLIQLAGQPLDTGAKNYPWGEWDDDVFISVRDTPIPPEHQFSEFAFYPGAYPLLVVPGQAIGGTYVFKYLGPGTWIWLTIGIPGMDLVFPLFPIQLAPASVWQDYTLQVFGELAGWYFPDAPMGTLWTYFACLGIGAAPLSNGAGCIVGYYLENGFYVQAYV